MDTQMEGQAPQPEWQNVNEGSPKLSQPRADSQSAIILDQQPEQPPQLSSQTKNLADEKLDNPEQIGTSETVKETLVNGDVPKEALTLEAEKPSSGTADNTVPIVANLVQNVVPVNNDQLEDNPENIVQNDQTNTVQEVPDYDNIQNYYHQPEYIEPKEEKLFTITMNTYQACRLNSQLCNFGMRVEPIDLNAKKPNNKKRTQKKPAKLTYTPQYTQNQIQRKPIQKYGIAAQLETLEAQIPNIQRSKQEENKGTDGEISYPQKPSDGSEDSGIGVSKIMRVDTHTMKEGEYEDSELAGLQPSPQRMSSRRHEHVAGRYQDMARGIKLDENENAGVTADTQLRRAASTISQKPAQQANNNKKNIEENKAKIKALLENIKHHEFFDILQNSLDVTNPANEQYKSQYKIFTLIEIQFDDNRFTNSNQLKQEIVQQLQVRIKMFTSNEIELKNTLNLFNSVKGWFELCDNLSLVEAPADKRPKPVPNGQRRPPPRPAPQPKPAPATRAENGGGSQATQKIILNTVPPEMSPEDKNRLKNNIGLLTQEQKKKVVPIVKKCLQGQGNNNPIFEFELDQLTNECLRELEQYVDKEIKSNEKKRKRKEADKLRRQKRIQNKQEKMPANKYPYPQSQGLEIPPAAVANPTEAALAAQQKIGGAVHPNQMAIQQQLAQFSHQQLTQLSHPQITQAMQAQQVQTLLAQLQQGQAFPGMPAPVAQQQQQFQRPAQSQQPNMAAQNPVRKAHKLNNGDDSESSSSSSESD